MLVLCSMDSVQVRTDNSRRAERSRPAAAALISQRDRAGGGSSRRFWGWKQINTARLTGASAALGGCLFACLLACCPAVISSARINPLAACFRPLVRLSLLAGFPPPPPLPFA